MQMLANWVSIKGGYMAMSILYPASQFNYGGVPGQESKLFYLPGKLFYSDTDAAAAGAAAGAVAAASAAAVCMLSCTYRGARRAPPIHPSAAVSRFPVFRRSFGSLPETGKYW